MCNTPTPRPEFIRGYREYSNPHWRVNWRDLQSVTPKRLISEYARGFVAGAVALMFGVDLSGGEA